MNDSLESRSEDVEARAREYERRVSAAGSTESIVGGLVAGAKRSQRIARVLTVSLALDLILSLGLAVVAYTQHVSNDDSCVQSAKNTVVLNEFLNLLIHATATSNVLTPAQQANRVEGYRQLRSPIPDCYTPPKP